MTQLTVIGTGNMGQAIAGLATKGGHSAELIAHSHTGSAVTGNIVILAVPYPALADVIAVHGESLAGRIVVDITNPLDFQSFDSLTAHPTAPPRRNWQRPCRNRGAQGVQHHPRRRHRRPVADDRADRG